MNKKGDLRVDNGYGDHSSGDNSSFMWIVFFAGFILGIAIGAGL